MWSSSIAYLDHRILGTQLPEVQSALECLHEFYRNAFSKALENQERVSVPWLWGAGVDSSVERAIQKLSPLLVEHGVPTDFVQSRASKQ